MSKPEATLQAHIIKGYEARGAYVAKIHQTGRGRRGIPDVLACYRGYYVALEIKATTPVSDHQRRELHAIMGAGGIAAVVRSIEAAIGILDQIDALHDKEGVLGAMGQRVIVGHIPPANIVELDAVA